ncbi:MAG: hypothetical protein J6R67_03210 [Treponema sp.]|nr:hypothetical protein [Treponema sp.]
MPYQKTAKDKAWDKERQKLKSEINGLTVKCGQKEHTIQCQTGEIAILKNKIEKLEQAISYLTEGKATPEEILKKLDKNAELADMMQFLARGIQGMLY